jgi:hypothetical protein
VQSVGPWLRGAFILLLAAAVFPPFVSILGPVSLDDLLPLIAVVAGLLAIPLGPAKIERDPIFIAFAALGVLGLCSAVANADSTGTFFWLAGRSTGRAAFYLSLILTTRGLLAMPEGWAKKGIAWLVILASVEAAFCVFAFVADYHGPFGFGVAEVPSWSVLSGHARVHGTFSGDLSSFESVRTSSNFLAAYLLMTIPLSTGLALVEKRSARWLAFLGTALQLIALYLTYTRAALVALAIAILVVGWLAGQRTLSLIAVVSGACATLAIPTMRAKFLGEGQDRYALWWSGFKIAKEHPLAGIGDGRYMDLLFYSQRYHETPFGWSTSTSHNSILLAAANYGLLGGFVQLAIYVAMVHGALKVFRSSNGAARVMALAVIGSLVGYLVQDQFTNLAYVPKVATQLWYLVGLAPLVPAAFAEPPKALG